MLPARRLDLLDKKAVLLLKLKIRHQSALLLYLLLQMVLLLFLVVFGILWKMEVIQPVPISELCLWCLRLFVTAAVASYRVVAEKGGRCWWARKANLEVMNQLACYIYVFLFFAIILSVIVTDVLGKVLLH